ncbi:MAG: hypothetical protein ACR2IR_10075 [Acidimicrobiia bacterium]
MPTYELGGKTFRRKNFYMPCIIGPRVKDMSDDERVAVMKATYWADNITNAEWPAVLRHDDCSPSAKSRLKKKAAGWLMALQRIAKINPELFEEIAAKADAMYREQIEEEPVVRLVWDGRLFESELDWPVGAPVDWHPVADPPQPDGEEG